MLLHVLRRLLHSKQAVTNLSRQGYKQQMSFWNHKQRQYAGLQLQQTYQPTSYKSIQTNPESKYAHLLISVHEVHNTIMMVVVVHVLGCIHRQHQVVGSQPIPLCVSITEDTCLQHLVITVANTCKCKCRCR